MLTSLIGYIIYLYPIVSLSILLGLYTLWCIVGCVPVIMYVIDIDNDYINGRWQNYADKVDKILIYSNPFYYITIVVKWINKVLDKYF